jgi:hypothetical protein
MKKLKLWQEMCNEIERESSADYLVMLQILFYGNEKK